MVYCALCGRLLTLVEIRSIVFSIQAAKALGELSGRPTNRDQLDRLTESYCAVANIANVSDALLLLQYGLDLLEKLSVGEEITEHNLVHILTCNTTEGCCD